MKKLLPTLAAAFTALAASASPASAESADLPAATAEAAASSASSAAVAEDFSASGDFSAAALEYRRAEADCDPLDCETRGALLVAAAESYRACGEWDRMGRALSRIEGDGDVRECVEEELCFLRMRRAEGRREWADAAEWGETLAEALAPDSSERAAAARLAAADWLMALEPGEARRVADGDAAATSILDGWEALPRKSPRVGGLLGMVPGLGYAYSGEWGNAVRSLLLNGLFGWAMYETAERDQWALFGVSTFFELTWYTGSIYGGVDAAHRRNRERLEGAADELRGRDAPAVHRVPGIDLFRVRLEF